MNNADILSDPANYTVVGGESEWRVLAPNGTVSLLLSSETAAKAWVKRRTAYWKYQKLSRKNLAKGISIS